ncbi:unnamed protein product [Brachionus calyciflorus]|uniref:UPAR/Ly6 domain-containing protein n=1 Tax=Brachionus calyciflorus TaxID=104777 RepID=A0A814PF60_9BILA|nr:unnamed protein product [Brachionus calyciflorus]
MILIVLLIIFKLGFNEGLQCYHCEPNEICSSSNLDLESSSISTITCNGNSKNIVLCSKIVFKKSLDDNFRIYRGCSDTNMTNILDSRIILRYYCESDFCNRSNYLGAKHNFKFLIFVFIIKMIFK